MPHLELAPDAGDLVLTTEYREKDLVRMVPGAHWDRDARTWRLPRSWGSCVAARGVFGPGLEVGPRLVAWATAERTRVDYLRWLRALPPETRLDPALAVPVAGLFNFQELGVAFLHHADGGALLADEMGAGKTAQALALLELDDLFPALVVCPNTMKYTWEAEAARWLPGRSVVVVDGNVTRRRRALAERPDLVVINWEAVRLHSRLAPYGSVRLTDAEREPGELNAPGWRAVVADEAHRLKDPKSKQTRAVKAVADGAPEAYRLALTGTPVVDDPGQLWSLLNFVAPLDFPRYTTYVDRYCQLAWNPFGAADVVGVRAETRAEFDAIVQPRLIRRLKAAVLPQLPAKLPPQVRVAPMGTRQAKAYREMAREMVAELENGHLAAFNPLTRMVRLTQFASAFARVEGDQVLLTEPSCKIDALVDLVDEAAGTPLVVFAESRQLVQLAEARLARLGVGHGSIHGGVPVAERQVHVERFQRGELPVMLATTGAGGEGITLTAASTVVFLQRSWSLVQNAQAEDRVHRPGQAEPVTVIDVVAPGTVEEYKALRLADKAWRVEDVLRDADNLREMLSYAG